MIAATFVGYLESDDTFYFRSAAGWVAGAPYLGLDHWGLRHAIVLPMALGFRLFGQSEATLLLPSLGYAASLLVLIGVMANHLAGWRAAVIAIAVTGVTPIFVTGASLVTTDLPEALFVIGSLWAWHRARETLRPGLMVVSGLAAGCAFITRETTVALIAFYGLVFVAERGRGLVAAMLMAGGFLLVAGSDWLYLYVMSDDPLYRIHIAMAGAQNDGPHLEQASETQAAIDRFGALVMPRLARPFGAVFLNQNFGLLLWAAVPATAYLVIRAVGEVRRAAAMLLGFFATWFFVCGYILAKWLWVIPRYYAVGLVLIIPLAVWLTGLMQRRPARAWAMCSLIAGSGLLLTAASTIGAFAGERGLVKVVQTYPGTIYTDPATALGASWLLAREGLDTRVSTDMPDPGALFYFDSRPRRPFPANWPLRTVPAGWMLIETTTHSTKWTGPLTLLPGVKDLLPADLRAKLNPAPLVTSLYRVPDLPINEQGAPVSALR